MGVIEALFLANCGISIASYLPQLVKLVKDKTDSASVSIGSWMIWVYTSAISFIYALFENGDLLFMLSSGLAVFFCALVLGILAFNRHLKFRIAGRQNISILDMVKSKQSFDLEPEMIPEVIPVKIDE
jgi:uncharacterized protein with PQ loop repeat